MPTRSSFPQRKNAAAFFALYLCLFGILFGAPFHAAASAARTTDKKAPNWESWALKGNEYRERDCSTAALRSYQTALKILEKAGINDLRKAIILNNMADTYRSEDNMYAARMQELLAATIYKREIENHQLGYEYSAKKPVDFNSGSLRPLCYLCHENWKVVPILYGKTNGYAGEIPSEDDAAYTHKPGGPVYGDQRWYCRDCHQTF